ncbi:carboxypeptidase regulatory-like domain-containing protein [Candidatus Oscillochloris fontis]|uniref:carboxypeptidase regulatory-like domain-containing protein n=1 Tax=Candidatus Oscillochloris fontis TaxID=2496868 RepID=UPI0013758DE8|nr:carboxypeptidase regulatory-like domain-containing protein [Candidatus Oscillochloris fontis]
MFFQQLIPPKPHPRQFPPPRPYEWEIRVGVRIGTLILALVLVILVIIKIAQSPVMGNIGGYGSISGVVIDSAGRPTSAEIIIEQTNLIIQTDANGRFTLEKVPAGAHLMVVARGNLGVEYPIVAVAGNSVDIGQVEVVTTAVPER